MRRMAQKQGADQPKRPERKQPAPSHTSERTSPGQFLMEVRGELRKVAWPTRPEVINSTIIVLIAVVVMTALIFGADYVFAKGVLFLYD
jgi:preprotein translocase subunit SecE